MSDRSTLLLEHHLKELKLPSFLREYGKMAALCAAEGVDHPQYLLRLAELELIDRHQRMVERRIRAARFPAVKSLDTFDFPAIPSVNKALVMELARCEYIERRENVIAVGNSGTGKTHIALGLGLAACQRPVGHPASESASVAHRGPRTALLTVGATAEAAPRRNSRNWATWGPRRQDGLGYASHQERPRPMRRRTSGTGVQRQLVLPVPSIILAGSPPVPGSVFEPLRFDSWGRRIPE